MFTGLIEEVGRVNAVRRGSGAAVIGIAAGLVTEGLRPGDSVSVDGVCQTVTARSADGFTVEALGATLRKTTLGTFRAGRHVNLERAVTPATRLGGHFVQGHVSGTAPIVELRAEGENVWLTLRLPEPLLRYCIPEGSIAIDGMSLTIARLADPLATINIIPHTFSHTALRHKRAGDAVNVETDLLGRYVERLLGADRSAGITAEKLSRLGWQADAAGSQ